VTDSFGGLTVVVTGAAGGIGSELCRLFDSEGARVVAVDHDEAALAQLGEKVVCHQVAVDLTDGDATRAALADVGPVDVLVNNAGVTALGAAGEISLPAVEQVVAVNFLGSVNATIAVLGSLVERRGRIGVMSSVAGFAPLVYRTAYAGSKHALHGFFESLRVELAATGVSVTMVCPAFADTGIATRAVARGAGSTGEWSTTGRHQTAGQVAERTISGIRARKRLVLPGSTAKTAYWASRVAPAAYERMMRKRIS
jgi:short-subunit dehydrogenase